MFRAGEGVGEHPSGKSVTREAGYVEIKPNKISYGKEADDRELLTSESSADQPSDDISYSQKVQGAG